MTLTVCPKCSIEGKISTIDMMDGGFGCKTHGLTTVVELSSGMAEWAKSSYSLNPQTQPHIGNEDRP